jgi:hypothetical protein
VSSTTTTFVSIIISTAHLFHTVTTHEHAIDWITRIKGVTDKVWSQIQDSDSSSSPPVFEWCPVRVIREVNDDGSQIFLGDCGMDRWGYDDILNKEEHERLSAENAARKAGDEDIVWMIGSKRIPCSQKQC